METKQQILIKMFCWLGVMFGAWMAQASLIAWGGSAMVTAYLIFGLIGLPFFVLPFMEVSQCRMNH